MSMKAAVTSAGRSVTGVFGKFRPQHIFPLGITQSSEILKVQSHEVSHEHLESLAARDGLLAIVVKGFYDQRAATALASYLYKHPQLAQYNHEVQTGNQVFEDYLGVDRVGVPLNTFYNKDPLGQEWDGYFAQFHDLEREMAAVTAPSPTPFTATLGYMSTVCKDGAKRADFMGKPMFAGITRVTHSNKKTEIMHIDALPTRFAPFAAQLSFNVFCAVPPAGGELEVLKAPAFTHEEVTARPKDHDWSTEGEESIYIKPECGDLVLINTRRPHATKTFDSGSRVAVASFIGYNPGEPLQFWS